MTDYKAPDNIQKILANLPTSTGVYQMIDKRGEVIYVGKAKSLRNRVRSYFQPSNLDPKVIQMREHVRDIKILILENELVALTTEAQLISAHSPRYNVIWKDDKRYPYIVIRTRDPFPKVEITRRVDRRDGNRYFGPYASMWSIRITLDALRRAFPYLTCDREITGQDERACLYYDIKLCGGPCIGAQNQEDYRANIEGLTRALQGEGKTLTDHLQQQMEQAAENLDFEHAAILRDRIKALERATMRQYLVGSPNANYDVMALAQTDHANALVQMFIIRNGLMLASESFALEHVQHEDRANILGSFMTQYYSEAETVPPEVLLPFEVEDQALIEVWLTDKRDGKKVELSVPRRGDKRNLIKRAEETAAEQLAILEAQWAADTHRQESALQTLQAALDLPEPPNRIECFDISTLQGMASVASRVVFVQGTPAKAEYRRFNIKTIAHEGPDDFQSMREALTRRFQRHAEAIENQEYAPGQKDKDETWRLLPDLLLIDGGKGQLGVAVEVLEKFNLRDQVPVASLAKRIEEIFMPGRPVSIVLPRSHPGLQLVQRVRDEAHRFAITANREQRRKKGLASRLESIPGIGPAKRKRLLQHFNNDIDAIREASLEQLIEVPGITQEIAVALKEAL